MIGKKFGLNEYAVFVIKPRSYDDPKLKCLWLGHTRFQCAHCKKGYFNVRSDITYDDQCPECKYQVVVRWQG